jgi:predicted nuclease of predicted toxin-antitoxin system
LRTRPIASASFGAFPLPDGSPPLLFDENLAARLAAILSDVYPGSTAVELVGLRGAHDSAVWLHAATNGLVLVTKDEDFHRLSVVHGFPPKVIWIRLGNCGTADVARLLRARVEHVMAFVADKEVAFLALG